MGRWVIMFGFGLLSACTVATLPPEAAVGLWSSSAVSLELRAEGGTLSYQCGAGTIAGDWRLDPDGTFTGTGEHFFGGGPAPIEGRPPNRARYSGRIHGRRFTLTVSLIDLGQQLGPFELTRGETIVGPVCL